MLVVGECLSVCLHWQRSRFVGRTAHLCHIPVGGEIRHVDHSDVGAVAFHFLCIPEREGVVVAGGEDDAVFVYARQVVHAEVAAGIASAAVVVVPCLAYHLERNEYAECHCCNDKSRTDFLFSVGHLNAVFAFFFARNLAHGIRQQFVKTSHAHAYPDGKGIE